MIDLDANNMILTRFLDLNLSLSCKHFKRRPPGGFIA